MTATENTTRGACYWRKRRAEAIANALAYLDLARHYRNMIELTDHSSASN